MEKLEDLSNDIIEDNFARAIRNIYILQNLLGCSRAQIKNRFATPPTVLQKSYTVIVILLLTGSTYIISHLGTSEIRDESVKTLAITILIFIYIMSICNIIHVRFFNGRRNTEFVVRMQKLDRLMKLNVDRRVSQNLKTINDVSLILVALACGSQQIQVMAFLGTSLCAFTIVLELLASSSVIYYFLIRMMYINHQIKTFMNQKENVREPIILEANIKWIDFQTYGDIDFATSKIDVFLRELFDLFIEFQELYKFQFFLFCVKLVIMNLMTFELAFYAVRNNYEISGLQVFILYSLIDIAIAIFTAYRFDRFNSEVRVTKRACIGVMSAHAGGPVREKARCMLSLIEESPPRFSVYDMWEMNAGVFVSMFGLVTTLMVSLTQFAFL